MRPVIAIVGRPNVGKSTLLNRLARRRAALVADTPGVTRDRLFVDANMGSRGVILVDTGGFDTHPGDELSRMVVEQAQAAIDEADLVLFLCDSRDGLHPVDQEVADVLRRSGKPVLCLVNKCDPGSNEANRHEFHRLGLDFLPISAAHGTGMDELEDLVLAGIGEPQGEERAAADADLKMCLLGRPNVGKSSLANSLSGGQRQIVSPIPGTTRDAVDIALEQDGIGCLLVDTPGVRRRARISVRLEQYSVLAALRSLERADVAVVVIDGAETFSDQDARLLSIVNDRGRGLVIAVNKTDLLDEPGAMKQYFEKLEHGARFVSYAPIVRLSAKTGRGVGRLLPECNKVARNLSQRVSTGDLNRLVAESLQKHQPPLVRGKRAKIYYITQAEVKPPTFVASVNDPSRLPQHYRRYLENQLRARFAFIGVPLRWRFRKRGESGGKNSARGSKRRKR